MRRTNVLWGVVFLLAGASSAQPSTAGTESCPDIADDKQRLACFDRESALERQRARASNAQKPTAGAAPEVTHPATTVPAPTPPAPTPPAPTPPAPAPPAPPAPAVTELTPEQRMGLPPGKVLQLQGSTTHDLKEMTAKIRYVSARDDGRGWFTLENGQVWRQVELDPTFRVRPGDTVRITRGLFGSYFMSLNRHTNTRVSRTQ